MKRGCYRRKADDFEVDSEGRAKMRKCCGTCGWHKYDDDVDFICSNEESEGYGEYTMYEDSCDCWEGRDER